MYYNLSFGFSVVIEMFMLHSYRSGAYQFLPKLVLVEFAMIVIIIYTYVRITVL